MRPLTALIPVVLSLAACKDPAKGPTFAESLTEVCETRPPAHPDATEVADLLDDESMPKVDRLMTLRDAVHRAGLQRCPRLDALSAYTPPPPAQAIRLRQPKPQHTIRVAIEDVSVGRGCDAGQVKQVAATRLRGLQYCYEKELAREPDLVGNIDLSGTIDRHGRVVDTEASGSIGNPTVLSCVRRQFKRWRFPTPIDAPCSIDIAVRFGASQQ